MNVANIIKFPFVRFRLKVIGTLLEQARRGEWETNTSEACSARRRIRNFLLFRIADLNSDWRSRAIAWMHFMTGAKLGLW